METGRAKVSAAGKFIVDLVDKQPEDDKILVFAHHLEV